MAKVSLVVERKVLERYAEDWNAATSIGDVLRRRLELDQEASGIDLLGRSLFLAAMARGPVDLTRRCA
ncbi:MAG TPA: hypothetical protein VF341_05780, partial [Anaeromyxobacteraceae bacterium]